MKKILGIALLLSLAACSPNGGIPTPGNVAEQTVMDEQIAIGVEKAAIAITKLGNATAAAGLIDKNKYKVKSAELRKFVLASRTAYDTGNASDFNSAIANANLLITEIGELVK